MRRLYTAIARIGLLGRFTLLSLVATMLLGVGLGDLVSHEIRTRALRSAAQSAQLVASFGLQVQLSYTDLEQGTSPETIQSLDYLFLSGYQAGTLAQVDVMNTHRRVIYSNNHSVIDTTAPRTPGLTAALKGQTTAEVVGHGDKMIESFVPLKFSSIGAPDGAFEVYTGYAPVAAAIAHDTRRLYLALAVGLLLFYVLLFRIVAGASGQLRRQANENHRHARLDALTALPNRRAFFEHADDALPGQASDDPCAVMVVDLDRFKEVNDTLGHHSGDLLLQAVALRIRDAVRDCDVVSRLGGDEFAVLLRGASEDVAREVAQRIATGLGQRFNVEGATMDIEASMGIALFPQHGTDVHVLLQRADLAMYRAKERHDGFSIYMSELDSDQPGQMSLLGDLRHALEHGELTLHYQPKASLSTRQVSHVEALVRWERPGHGLQPPSEFIPLAERTGLIRQLSVSVLDAALRQLRAWSDAGRDLSVAVNLSARNLLEDDLPETVARLLADHEVPAERLILEITESAIMADETHSMDVLVRLSELGVCLSIDDYGTGYSSLSRLRRLPVDEIKIDRSFVAHMDRERGDALIVQSTVELAHNLGLRVVAEGVETKEIWEALGQLGCDYAQGYFLCKPMAPDELCAWLEQSGSAQPVAIAP
ncbi:MAG TPA: EAL domain-containing protein [Solirubrobacteraceae bacterium]|jgi:diguanylate cyclase (GGDEF)-like protein|nr:EAL domain-containing protein [Solirubrobacteraceae bacterium]